MHNKPPLETLYKVIFYFQHLLFCIQVSLISVPAPIVLRTTPLSLKLKLLQTISNILGWQLTFLSLIQVNNWYWCDKPVGPWVSHFIVYVSVTHISSGGSTKRLAHKYFSLLDLESIKRLYDLYKIDFELFDYNHVDYLQMAKDFTK